jgi:hypothetical protein
MTRALLLALLLAAAPAATQSAAGQPAATQPAAAQGAAEAEPRAIALPDGVNLVYWPAQNWLAGRLADRLRQLPPLPALPPDVLDREGGVRVLLAPDEATFSALTGGLAPEWGAGVALPGRGVAVVPAYASDRVAPTRLLPVIRHELAHLALHAYLAPARPPRWFDEGYAVWASGSFDAEAAWQLRLAFATGRAPPLDSLALHWPALESDARVAYLLSATAVGFLVDRGGERVLRIFLERWRESGDMEEALRTTYGLNLGLFELHWRQEVRRRYGWALFFSHTLVFWVFAAALLLALRGVRRRRDRERLEELRRTEPPAVPAYWLEVEDAPPEERPYGDGGDGGDGPAPERKGAGA